MIWAAVDYGALSSTETHGLVCFHRILHGVERQSVVLVFVFVVIIFALEVRVWCVWIICCLQDRRMMELKASHP